LRHTNFIQKHNMKYLVYPLLFLLFNPVSGSANADECFDKDLNRLFDLTIEELMNIEVESSTRSLTPLNKAPSSIVVFTAEDIYRLGAKSLTDLVQTVAGVQVQTRVNNREGFWVRGISSEFNQKTALYIDGIPQRNFFGGFDTDMEIPIETAKRIEIIKGPGSALYGANAFSGVIHIYTFKPGESCSNGVETTLGSDNTASGYISLDGQLSSVNLLFESKLYKTKGQSPLYDRRGNPISIEQPQQQGFLSLKASTLNGDLLLSGSLNRFDNERAYKGLAVDNPREHETIRFNIHYQHDFREGLALEANAYYNKMNRNETEDVYTVIAESRSNIDESWSFTDNTEMLGSQIMLNYYQLSRHTINLGLEAQREKLTSSDFTNNLTGDVDSFVQDPAYHNIHADNYGAFIQDIYNVPNYNTELTFGLRYDFLDLFDNQFSYRLGLVQTFSEQLFGKLLYGTAFRTPTFLEFSRAPEGLPIPEVENVKTIEALLGYQSANHHLSLTTFINNYDDIISRNNSLFGESLNMAEEQFGNLDKQVIYGLELESRHLLAQDWDLFTNLAWQQAKSKETDLNLALLADWTISAGLDYHFNISEGDFLFHNHVVIYGEREPWSDEVWDPEQQHYHSNRTDNFGDEFIIWDIGLHYRFNAGFAQGLGFSLTAENLFNKEYYTQHPVVPASNRIASGDAQYPQRSVYLKASYQW